MANRHLSRSVVLQTLFEWDFLSGENPIESKKGQEKDIKVIIKRNIDEFAPGLDDDQFIIDLTELVLKKKSILDEIIEKAAPEWPINKIGVVDRNILRMGLAELLFGDRTQVPPKVAINESIELAKTFGGENSSKFINGVLGAVYKEIGEPGKEQMSKRQRGPEEPVDITKLPKEQKAGAVVFAKNEGSIYFAFVHDVFGYWTLSKGGVEKGETPEEAVVREIKEETDLDIKVIAQIGQNEYVASPPGTGKILKQVTYFLAESKYSTITLEKGSGGLTDAKWFLMSEIGDLKIYDDILPLLGKAIAIITEQKND